MLEIFWLIGPFFVWRLMMKDGLEQPMVESQRWARFQAAAGVVWYALWHDDDEDEG